MNTRFNIFLWALYDFANSFLMIVFLFYFSQWIVIDGGKPDWWFNATLVASSLMFILTAPVAAQVVDRSGEKLPGLRLNTLLALAFYLVTALITLLASSYVLLATITSTLALYFYLFSFVYYTPLLSDLSGNHNRSFISGVGQGANTLGQILGLILAIPFASGTLYLFGDPGRAQTLLPAVLAFAVLSAPMLIWFREGEGSAQAVSVTEEYKKVLGTLRGICSVRNLSLILTAYFLFSDAYLTFGNNYPIFLQKVFGVDDLTKSLLTAAILTVSSVGATALGVLADKFGRKNLLIVVLGSMCVLLALLSLSTSFYLAAIISLICGLFYGPAFSISRAMVAEYAPEHIRASSFSYYVLAERFATFLGPLIWSGVLLGAASYGAQSYSFAVLSMAALVLISLPFIWLVRESPKQ